MRKLPPLCEVIVQNIVCTASVGRLLYLPGIARRLRYGEYNPKRFSAVTFRLRSPKSTALYFGSGKIVCTGTKSKNAARLAVLKYVRLLRTRAGIADARMFQFKVQNIVASAYCGFALDLDQIRRLHPAESSYEPQLFPGLIFRFSNYRIVFLLFASGRMVITGCRFQKQTKQAFDRIFPLLFAAMNGDHSGGAAPKRKVRSDIQLKDFLKSDTYQDLVRDGMFADIEFDAV